MQTDKKRESSSRQLAPSVAGKKSRVVSLPPTLSSISTQPSVYSNPSSRFSGSGSPPIIDFTEWADNFRGQRFGFNLPNEFPPDTPRSGPHSILNSTVSLSPHEWRIDFSVLINGLRPLMESQGKKLEDFLDVDSIAALHQRDRESRSGRGLPGHEGGKLRTTCVDGVIGMSLSEVALQASLSVPIAGTEHSVPIIVVKCIEELYRTGLYQHQLFRKTPNFARVEELLEVYDHRDLPQSIRIARQRAQHCGSGSGCVFGSQTSLHMEATENICALLRTFLQSLPEPILSPCLFEAVWVCCGVRQDAFQSGFHTNPSQGRAPLNRLGSSLSQEELVRIYIAQIMLHLLPTPNFSLLVYLLSFYSQVVMVHEENGLAIEDVASMFGAIIFGGANERIVSWTDSKPRPRGEVMMRWFLRRWRQIYHGLFPYDDEGRLSHTGVTTLSPIREAGETIPIGRPASGYFGLQEPSSMSRHDALPSLHDQLEKQDERCLTPDEVSTGPGPGNLSPAMSTASLQPPQLRTPQSSDLASNYLEEVWPHLTSKLRVKLNERMLDVMLEPLLTTHGSNMKRQRSNSVPTRLKPTPLHNPAANNAALHSQLTQANHRIAKLEHLVHDNKCIARDLAHENRRVKQEKLLLEARVKELEVELKSYDERYKQGEECVREGLKEVMDGLVRERDEARGIVSEIQRLSGLVRSGRDVTGGLARN